MSLLRTLWLFVGMALCTTLLSAQSEYSYMPKKVYENQLFPVTIIRSSENDVLEPQFTFDSSSTVQPLFSDPLIVKNGNDSFYTFYFKASKDDMRIPTLLISSQNEETSLDSQTVLVNTLKKRKDFCNVLAADMKIKNSQVSNYDENNYIVTLSLEAFEANIEDMVIKNVKEYGVEELERDHAKVQAEFYAILPLAQNQLKFTYFNTIKNQYIFLEVPIALTDSSVSAQSDLNPKEDSFEQLKKYIFIALAVFFFLMFLLKRDFFYLVLAVISFITLLTFFTPHETICVKQGAPLYILPTRTSTISTTIDKEFNTMLLGERAEFSKVEYQTGIIGWVKNEDLCEN